MNKTNYSYNLNYELFLEDSKKDSANKIKIVQKLISIYGGEFILSEWTKFLKNNIKNRKDAYNFTACLYLYDFHNCCVKNPYLFLALLYKKLELDKLTNDKLDKRFDSPSDRFIGLYLDCLYSSKIISLNEYDFTDPKKDIRFLKELGKLETINTTN